MQRKCLWFVWVTNGHPAVQCKSFLSSRSPTQFLVLLAWANLVGIRAICCEFGPSRCKFQPLCTAMQLNLLA